VCSALCALLTPIAAQMDPLYGSTGWRGLSHRERRRQHFLAAAAELELEQLLATEVRRPILSRSGCKVLGTATQSHPTSCWPRR
jgi:hypothetical protein